MTDDNELITDEWLGSFIKEYGIGGEYPIEKMFHPSLECDFVYRVYAEDTEHACGGIVELFNARRRGTLRAFFGGLNRTLACIDAGG